MLVIRSQSPAPKVAGLFSSTGASAIAAAAVALAVHGALTGAMFCCSADPVP